MRKTLYFINDSLGLFAVIQINKISVQVINEPLAGLDDFLTRRDMTVNYLRCVDIRFLAMWIF